MIIGQFPQSSLKDHLQRTCLIFLEILSRFVYTRMKIGPISTLRGYDIGPNKLELICNKKKTNQAIIFHQSLIELSNNNWYDEHECKV